VVFSGLVEGDAVTLGGSGVGTFTDKHVGIGKSVIVTGYALSGVDAGNYEVGQPLGLTADISQKALTVSGITASDKVYDGNTSATVSTANASLNGLVAGDSLSVNATGVFMDKHAGTGKTVNLSSSYVGDDVGNYAITDQAGTAADISQKALTVSGITASDKVYDGNTSATVSMANASLNGLVAGDSLSVNATGAFVDKNTGMGKTVNLNSSYVGDDVGNYAITDQSSATATVTRVQRHGDGHKTCLCSLDGGSQWRLVQSGQLEWWGRSGSGQCRRGDYSWRCFC
jgi:hypothetical protein